MSNSKLNAAVGTDWTGLLADPDLSRNMGKLLQTYREAPPERREEALLAAMREIKTSSFQRKRCGNFHEGGACSPAFAYPGLRYSSV